MLLGFVITFVVTFLGVASGQPQSSPIITTKSGEIQGQIIQLTPWLEVYQFTAIPFAEPPTGLKRFRKPEPIQPWGDILDATGVPNACPQFSVASFDPSFFNNSAAAQANMPKGAQSEDCLFLNIWVPKRVLDETLAAEEDGGETPVKKSAVYTFIHGGAFVTGAISMDMYNGSILAAYNDIIVVTIQYRLGSLGFAYIKGNNDVPGNMGLWDQLEAMKWIHENIGAFGGNNSEITIGGESAGAASVSFHLLSPQSRRYFQRAIIESGTALAFWAQRRPEEATMASTAIFAGVAPTLCPQIRQPSPLEVLVCARSAAASTFPLADAMAQAKGIFPGPVIDGDFLPRNPVEMLEQGDFYKAPLLIGANKDEGSMFVMMSPGAKQLLPQKPGPDENAMIDALNYTHYTSLLTGGLKMVASGSVNPLLIGAVQLHYWPTRLQGYPKGRDVLEAVVAATGDYALTCPTYMWADKTANMAPQIYAYYFTRSNLGAELPNWLGAMHGAEISYVFGQPFSPRGVSSSKDDKSLSGVMMAYWSNFIKNGDPNVKDTETYNMANIRSLKLRNWPTYVDGEKCRSQFVELNVPVQVYNRGPGVICGLKARDCAFWETFAKLANMLPATDIEAVSAMKKL